MNHVQLDTDAAKDWLSKGVQPSDTVHNILVSQKVISAKKLNVLPKKSPIVDEEALKKAEEERIAAEEAAKAEAEAAESADADSGSEASKSEAAATDEAAATEDSAADQAEAEAAPAEEAPEGDDTDAKKEA